jgi:hypothetical protein
MMTEKDAKLDVAGDIKKVSWIHTDGSKKEIVLSHTQ